MRNMLLSRKPLLLACLLFMNAICFAQVTQQWVKRQNGDFSHDAANGLVVDHKCNIYVTGRSQGIGTNSDYTTIKYNDDGDKKWERRYNGPGNGEDEAVAIAKDSKGNVYVTGWSTGIGTGRDFATVKYDDDGDTKWVQRYNGPGNGVDQATAIATDRWGNVYVTGFSTGSGSGLDYATVKYDKDGNVKWIKRYNGPNNSDDQALAIAVDSNCNVYVTGFSTGIGTGQDYTTIKYDDDGDQEWVQRYNGLVDESDIATALAVDAWGNVYVTGSSTNVREEDFPVTDIVTIKYNTSGQQQWIAIYNGRTFDAPNDIALDGSGNIFITGTGGNADEALARELVTLKYNTSGIQQWAVTVRSPNADDDGRANDLALDKAGNVYITGLLELQDVDNFVTIKYNTNGVQQWMALYKQGTANAIGLDDKGNVYITGTTDPFPGDFATIKYNANGVQKWVQTYSGPGGAGPDLANAIAVDKDGNVHVTGGMTIDNTGLDYTTYKYDNNGEREWKKTYNGPGRDLANAITLDAEGNVYVTGTITGGGTGGDYRTIKYDKNGNARWGKTYKGPANNFDEATAIAVDKKGNVYVTGSSIGIDTTFDFATIKYDSNGVVKWIRRYTGNTGRADQNATAIAVDKWGNVYVTGESGGDYATIKYDGNGNQLWEALYNGPVNGEDSATSLALDALGNVYITGRSNGQNFDFATVKYNSAGVQQWAVRYETPQNDLASDIAVDASGNVYVTGGGSDYTTIKYNTAGVQQWVALYDGSGNSDDLAAALALDDLGNVYVTGESGSDYATVKYNPSGLEQWAIRYDGPGHSVDAATDIALDACGNVYVTGSSIGNGTNSDYATIKYEQTPVLARSSTVPEQNIADVPGRVSVQLTAKAFPNAFTDFINLQWSGSNKPVTITITDAMGRLVEKRTGLAYSGTIQTGYRFAKGIYYAEIVQGTEKIVLKLVRH